MEPTIAIAIISVGLSGIQGILQLVFHHTIQSRCTEIACCGCFCKRKLLDTEELELINKEKEPNH